MASKAITIKLAALAALALPVHAAEPGVVPPAPLAQIAPISADIPTALLVDLGSGRSLLERQADNRFAPASVTKVMSAYVAFGLIAQGQLRRDAIFAVPDALAREWNGRGTSLYLTGGQQVSVDALIEGMTTVSANDAAMVLAETARGGVPQWTGLMNAQAKRLGMTNSHFATPNGWPDHGATFVSARDLVRLGRALIADYPQDYRRYFGHRKMLWNGVTQFSHDPTAGIVPGADGIKTGHTAEAGYNFLGSAQRGGRRLVLVIAGARSEAERADASRALLEWGFAAWQTRPLFAAGAVVAQARVQGGDARRVALTSPLAIYATLPRENPGKLALRVLYDGPIIAPIAKGAKVAELEIDSGDAPVSRVPLYARSAVGKAGLFDRLWNGLAGLFS